MNIKSIFEMPQDLTDGRLDSILEIIDCIKKGIDIELSFIKTKFISAAGHAILFSIFDIACEQRITLSLTHINKELNFHKELLQISKQQQPLRSFIDIEKLTIKSQDIIVYGKVSSIAPEFILAIEQKFSKILTEDVLWDITLIFNELMQNTVDHSTSERYFLYAGKNEKTFEFGILDMGVSIPAKLETKYICLNDQEYLKKVFIKGIGTRRNRTGGMGLYYLFENIKDAKGRLVILSRNAQVRLNFGTRNYKSSPLKKPLIGTWCMASIPLE